MGHLTLDGAHVLRTLRHQVHQPQIEQPLAHGGEIAAPAHFAAQLAHVAPLHGEHQFEIGDLLGGGAIGHLGHHVVLARERGGDQVKAGEGFKKLIVPGSSGKGEIARGPEVDELVVDLWLLDQLGSGKESALFSTGACRYQGGCGGVQQSPSAAAHSR